MKEEREREPRGSARVRQPWQVAQTGPKDSFPSLGLAHSNRRTFALLPTTLFPSLPLHYLSSLSYHPGPLPDLTTQTTTHLTFLATLLPYPRFFPISPTIAVLVPVFNVKSLLCSLRVPSEPNPGRVSISLLMAALRCSALAHSESCHVRLL
jgi:hypothetical protein